MTNLNTIIEEETLNEIANTVYVPFDTTMPGAIHTYGQIPGLNATIKKAFTTAIQRAYEAGRAQENTPDTGWDKITFENEFAHWWNNKPALTERIEDHIQTLLTSRDTYWKERVRKEVEKARLPVEGEMVDEARLVRKSFNAGLDAVLAKLTPDKTV